MMLTLRRNEVITCSAIIFDMDGLMLDTEKLSYDAWNQAAKCFNCELDEDIYYSLAGNAIPIIESKMTEIMGAGFDIQKARKIKNAILEREVFANGIPLKSGLLELLDYLEKNNIRKAVASSTSRELVIHRLSIAKVLSRFELVVGGDEIKDGKPAPDIFLETAKLLGVSPNECVVLEDSLAGIKAATSAGMYTIMIPDQQKSTIESSKLANQIFSSLSEVVIFLEKQLNTVA